MFCSLRRCCNYFEWRGMMSDLHKMLKGINVDGVHGSIHLYDRFVQIKDGSQEWLSKLGKNGFQHSVRLEKYLNTLTRKAREQGKISQISHGEAFILLSAVYMHDIGYLLNGHCESAGHPKRSKDRICENPEEFLLGDFPCMPGEHPRVAEAIGLVCQGHSDEKYLPLNSLPVDFSDEALCDHTLNLRELSAFLRIADEADDPYTRLVDDSTHPIRGKTTLVEIGDDTIIWHWKAAGEAKPDRFQAHLEEKRKNLQTSVDYLKELKLGYWFIELYPPVARVTPFMPQAPVDTFVGRMKDYKDLHRIIQKKKHGAITGIVGTGGIGKTELAKVYAQAYREMYPGGIFWASMKNSDWKIQAEEIFKHLEPGGESRVFPDTGKAKDEVQKALSHREALLIIDNVTEADQIIKPECFLLVTSRDREVFGILSHDAIHKLSGLSPKEGKELLIKILGRDRVNQDTIGVKRIVEILGGMPLAVEIAGKHLADAHGLSFTDYIGKIEGKIHELKVKNIQDKDVEASLELSLEQLAGDDNGKELISLFDAVSVCAPAGFTAEILCAAAGIGNLDTVDQYRYVGRLYNRSLLEFDTKSKRYGAHPLLRQLAQKRLLNNEEQYNSFRKNHCQHFLHYAEMHSTSPDKLINERDGLWQALVQATQIDHSGFLIQEFLRHVGRPYQDLLETGENEKAFKFLVLANVINIDELGESKTLVEFLEPLMKKISSLEIYSQGWLLTSFGIAHIALGDYRKALELYGQALEINRRIGDIRGEGTFLNNMGLAHAALGDYRKALELYGQALEINRRIGDIRGEGAVLGNMGIAHFSLGDYLNALELHGQALEIDRRIGDIRGEGTDLGNMGNAHVKLGNKKKALECWNNAKKLFNEMGLNHLFKQVENNIKSL